MKTLSACILTCAASFHLFAQTEGPNNAGDGINSTLAGVISWTNPNSIQVSDDNRATANNGLTQILRASQFGFSIPPTADILGIEIGVEKQGRAINNVTAGTWEFQQAPNFVSGQPASTYNSTSYNYTLGTGVNRLLLVIIAIENVDNVGSNPSISLTSVTYGGQAMTALATQSTASTTTRNLIAVYYLREAQLSAVVGTSLTVNKSRSMTAPGNDNEYVEYLAINTFTEVNQLFPVDFVTASNSGAAVSAGPLNVRSGDYVLGALNSNSPGITYTQSAGNTLVSNVSANNVLASGITFNLQSRAAIASTGTLTPGITGSATSGRLNMINLVIMGGRTFDNLTQLQQGGIPVGSNLSLGSAAVSQAWPDNDQLIVYGNVSELWGKTWTAAEINDPDFGLDIQADASGASAAVDFVRASVTFNIPLPVGDHELVLHCHQSGISGKIVDPAFSSGSVQLLRSKDGFEYDLVSETYFIPDQHTLFLSDKKPGSWYYKIMHTSDSTTQQLGKVSFCTILDERYTKVYPNPASSEFYVQTEHPTPKKVSIQRLDGKIMKEWEGFAQEFRVDIYENNLPSGIYLIILDFGHFIEHHKITIN